MGREARNRVATIGTPRVLDSIEALSGDTLQIRLALEPQARKVRMICSIPVTSVGLAPDRARKLGEALIRCADVIDGKRT